MDDFISREDTIEKMEEVDWYHQNKNGEMVHGANTSEHQAWYKAEDVYKVLEDMPSAQPETAKRIVGKSRDGMTLWYQCDMCNEPVDAQDDFCRGCGRRLMSDKDTIYRQDAIDAIASYERDSTAPINYRKIIEELPSAQPERIQNNAVHLCDSCQYTYVTCPSHGNDAVFGDGKGNDNICACNKYRPISAQPEIIHCKDCRHNGSFDTDCPIGWNGKEYCSFAER